MGVVGDVGVVASEVRFPHKILGEPILHILQFYAWVFFPCVPQGICDGAEEFAIDLSDGGILVRIIRHFIDYLSIIYKMLETLKKLVDNIVSLFQKLRCSFSCCNREVSVRVLERSQIMKPEKAS